MRSVLTFPSSVFFLPVIKPYTAHT